MPVRYLFLPAYVPAITISGCITVLLPPLYRYLPGGRSGHRACRLECLGGWVVLLPPAIPFCGGWVLQIPAEHLLRLPPGPACKRTCLPACLPRSYHRYCLLWVITTCRLEQGGCRYRFLLFHTAGRFLPLGTVWRVLPPMPVQCITCSGDGSAGIPPVLGWACHDTQVPAYWCLPFCTVPALEAVPPVLLRASALPACWNFCTTAILPPPFACLPFWNTCWMPDYRYHRSFLPFRCRHLPGRITAFCWGCCLRSAAWRNACLQFSTRACYQTCSCLLPPACLGCFHLPACWTACLTSRPQDLPLQVLWVLPAQTGTDYNAAALGITVSAPAACLPALD